MPGRFDGKPCSRCGRNKTPKRRQEKYCGPCERLVSKEQARLAHGRYLYRTYGITIEEYEEILLLQGGTCYICQRATGRTRRLAVDHDHKLGSGRQAVRGLLCRPCNNGLGMARDDPMYFVRAISYLQQPPAWQVIPRSLATMKEPG